MVDPKPLFNVLTYAGGLALLGGMIGLAIGYGLSEFVPSDLSYGVVISDCIPSAFRACPPPTVIDPIWFGVVGALPGGIKFIVELIRDN